MILRDDGGVPDQAKRIAQELVVTGKVAILAGYNPTPPALAVAPLATEAKIPQIVVGSSASITTERSPYIVRTFAHAGPDHGADGAMGAEERDQTGRHAGRGLFAGRRDRESLRRRIQGRRRGDHRVGARAAAQSRFFSLPATRPRCQAAGAVRLGSRRARRSVPAAICGARPAGVRHPADRSRRYHRRRRAQSNGRRR